MKLLEEIDLTSSNLGSPLAHMKTLQLRVAPYTNNYNNYSTMVGYQFMGLRLALYFVYLMIIFSIAGEGPPNESHSP